MQDAQTLNESYITGVLHFIPVAYSGGLNRPNVSLC